MKFETYLPCVRLRPYVKHFVISEGDRVQTYKVLPGTSVVIGFQYSGKLSVFRDNLELPLSSAGVTGLMDGFRVFKNSLNTGTVLVVFSETGASQFFSNPLNELFCESLSLEYFFSKSEINYTAEQLSMADTDRHKIEIVERLLIGQMKNYPADLLVSKALEYIHHSKGTIRISDLAKILHTSQSPLEKRFRRVVGASPKKFTFIVRVKNIRSAIEQNDGRFMLFDAGYYDQSHFIKEFKAFTSLTPEQYLKDIKKSGNNK